MEDVICVEYVLLKAVLLEGTVYVKHVYSTRVIQSLKLFTNLDD